MGCLSAYIADDPLNGKYNYKVRGRNFLDTGIDYHGIYQLAMFTGWPVASRTVYQNLEFGSICLRLEMTSSMGAWV